MFACEDSQQNIFTTCTPLAAHQVAKHWPSVQCQRVSWYGHLTIKFLCVEPGLKFEDGEQYALGIRPDGCVERGYPREECVPIVHQVSGEVSDARWAEIYSGRPCIYERGGHPNAAEDHYYQEQEEQDIHDNVERHNAQLMDTLVESAEMDCSSSGTTPRSQASISDREDYDAIYAAASYFASEWYDYQEQGDEHCSDTADMEVGSDGRWVGDSAAKGNLTSAKHHNQ